MNQNPTKNEKIAQARADFLHALQRTFDHPDGQLVLAWLHATAATRKPAFLPSDRDPYGAAQRDGRKSLVWEIETNLQEARSAVGSNASDKPKATGAPGARRKGA
jgi:hypothetical protein